MRRRVLAAGAMLAALLAGCAQATAPGVTTKGRSLTVFLSAPAGQASDPVARDVLDAEALAFSQGSAQVSAYKLSLSRLQGAKISDNARTAIQTGGAAAYLGEVEPGSSGDSIGITNAQQLLQVSPTDTAAGLTQAAPGVPGAPERYYESLKNYGRTFARLAPTTTHEARAQLSEMRSLGVRSLYVASDGSAYASALVQALRTGATTGGPTVALGPPDAARFTASGADALFFATTSSASARQLFTNAAGAKPRVKLFAPSALADPAFAASLASLRSEAYVSTPGVMPRSLTPAGRAFLTSFSHTYGRVPGPQAIFGYEAMTAVLDVLKESGAQANNRAVVVRNFLAIRNRPSAFGPYSIDAAGDTSLTSFVFQRLRGGRLTPVAQTSG